MRKLRVIIEREYFSRVKKKSFILTTLLTPLAFGLFFVIIAFIMSYSQDGQHILVVDEGDLLTRPIRDTEQAHFTLTREPLDYYIDDFEEKGYDGILHIPVIENLDRPTGITFYSNKTMAVRTQEFLNRQLSIRVRDAKIDEAGLDKAVLERLESDVRITIRSMKDSERDQTATAYIASGMGFTMGIIMYMVVFIYGMMVMRSVMEEKTTRIVEVMISSVKPWQLMMGKVIGVGAVGITQFAIWAILLPLIFFIASLFVPTIDPTTMGDLSGGQAPNPDELEGIIQSFLLEIQAINWWYFLISFFFFFVGGYFLYASLFAAVGSAVGDDMGESQSLTLPITIPIIIAFYLMILVIQNPNSSIAMWSSLFPLFSPIIMPARMAFDPPFWQVLLSMVILFGTAIFFTWISARIYRVGILMYGKKTSFAELIRWMFTKI